MSEFIMALDQGTTSSRAIIFNKEGRPVSSASKEFRQFFPEASWVEHDPLEIWAGQISVANEALLKINKTLKDVHAIGITNQRETTILWDKKTGEPVYPAIVWQDRRTKKLTDKMKKEGMEDFIGKRTGLVLDPYFSATKVKWILDNVKDARAKAERGDILFGTVDSFLVWMMTKGKVHVTDYTNASRTLLFDIHKMKWDKELLKLFSIPECILPEPVPSSQVTGYTAREIFGTEIPISGMAGDQQAALFGQACFEEGEMKSTYGTGGFLLMNLGNKAVASKNGLLTTVTCDTEGKYGYALEGSIFVAGALIKWLRDELKLIDNAEDTEYLAKKVENTEGVYIVPAFSGLGAPYWNPHARGIITGLTRGTNKSHIVRAALESIAYQNYDLLKLMEKDSKIKVPSYKVDGGASNNDFLMSFQADILGIPVERPEITETTALGACYLAGLSTGYFTSKDEIKRKRKVEKLFKPAMDEKEKQKALKGWKQAVKTAIFSAESVKL